MSDLVGNSEDRCSCDAEQLKKLARKSNVQVKKHEKLL